MVRHAKILLRTGPLKRQIFTRVHLQRRLESGDRSLEAFQVCVVLQVKTMVVQYGRDVCVRLGPIQRVPVLRVDPQRSVGGFNCQGK